MALFDNILPKPKQTTKHNYSFYVDPTAEAQTKSALAGTAVVNQTATQTNDLGVVLHPFDYSITEGLYTSFGIAHAAVDKMVDFVWGRGFTIKCDNDDAEDVLEEWMLQVDLKNIGKKWVREAMANGTSYIELDGKETEVPQVIKVWSGKRIYIHQTSKGEIDKFYQIKKMGGALTKDNVNSFNPYQIAYLPINAIGEDPYGVGIIYPNIKAINYFLQNWKDLHDVVRRKANAPIVATLGNKDANEYPDPAEVGAYGTLLSYMTNKTEWAVSANVALSVLDFGKAGENFEYVLRNDFEQLIVGFQTPETLMGLGNIAEGLAQEQKEGFRQRAASFQEEIEKVIETKMFSRVLRAKGIDAKVDIIWGQPSESDKQAKITQLTTLLSNMLITPQLRTQAEAQLAELLEMNVESLDEGQAMKDAEMRARLPKNPNAREYFEARKIKPLKKKE